MPRLPLPRSPLGRDLLLGLGLAAVAAVELVLTADQVEGPMLGHHVVSLLILPAVTLRRISPLASMAVASVGFAVEPLMGPAPVASPYLVLLFLLASLGWHASLRVGVAGVVLVLLAGLTYDVTTSEFRWADLVVNTVLIVAAWTAGHLLRVASDRRVRAEVEADRLAREAADAERRRIARDLHDSMAHALTLITLQAGSARERTEDTTASHALGSIERTGREALADMHRFLDLVGRGDDEAKGVSHVPDLVAGVRVGGLSIELDLRLAESDLPGSVSATAYRVVQEALTNVVRHSDARSARVDLTLQQGVVVVSVADDGRPTRSGVNGTGRGLAGLRERIDLFGGTLEAGATDRGWRVRVCLPVAGEP